MRPKEASDNLFVRPSLVVSWGWEGGVWLGVVLGSILDTPSVLKLTWKASSLRSRRISTNCELRWGIAACNFELLSMSYGLLRSTVACSFWATSLSGRLNNTCTSIKGRRWPLLDGLRAVFKGGRRCPKLGKGSRYRACFGFFFHQC